jgi:hypothetical protein
MPRSFTRLLLAFAAAQAIPVGAANAQYGVQSEVIVAPPTITGSVTIRGLGGAMVAGGLEINAGASDKVILDGLDFFGTVHTTAVGVRVISASEVLIRDCRFNGFRLQYNGFLTAGITLVNTASPVRVTINDSAFTDNAFGILVKSAPGMGHLKIFDTTIASSVTSGIQMTGAGNDVVLSNVQLIGNPKALDLLSGATAKSYGNNVITNGDMPAKIPLS